MASLTGRAALHIADENMREVAALMIG